jgi:hypothetical protein
MQFVNSIYKSTIMSKRNLSKNVWLTPPALVLSFSLIVCLFACREKTGDPQKFTELEYDKLTEKNVPKGITMRDGKPILSDGYEIVHSADSTKALFIQTGRPGGGTTAMRCDCDGLIKIGCIVVTEGIITCRPLLCNSCKPILQIYDGRISVEQFRK